MKVKILRIENRIVTCQIPETGSLIDIARRWFAEDIQVDDIIEFDVSNVKDNELHLEYLKLKEEIESLQDFDIIENEKYGLIALCFLNDKIDSASIIHSVDELHQAIEEEKEYYREKE